MTGINARAAAIVCGVLAFGLHVLYRLWVVPQTDELLPFRQALTVQVLAQLVAVVLALGMYQAIVWPMRRGPARFEVMAGRFVAPAAPFDGARTAILLSWFAGGFLGLAFVKQPIAPSMVMMLVLLGLAAACLTIQRPRVSLTPTGLVVQRLVRRLEIPWSEMAPGGPEAPPERGRNMKVYLNSEPVWGRFAVSEDVPVGWLYVDRAFLAYAIRHYAETAGHRPAIGEQAEYQRLQAGFGRGPANADRQAADMVRSGSPTA